MILKKKERILQLNAMKQLSDNEKILEREIKAGKKLKKEVVG